MDEQSSFLELIALFHFRGDDIGTGEALELFGRLYRLLKHLGRSRPLVLRSQACPVRLLFR